MLPSSCVSLNDSSARFCKLASSDGIVPESSGLLSTHKRCSPLLERSSPCKFLPDLEPDLEIGADSPVIKPSSEGMGPDSCKEKTQSLVQLQQFKENTLEYFYTYAIASHQNVNQSFCISHFRRYAPTNAIFIYNKVGKRCGYTNLCRNCARYCSIAF